MQKFHGTCKSQDNCLCNDDWAGEQCDLAKCFGISGNNPVACNGHGNCVNTNVCECETGWVSHDCSIPQCFGKNATDIDVCSGQGACIGMNLCKCNNKYIGEECQKSRLIIIYVAAANIPSWNWLCIIVVFTVIYVKINRYQEWCDGFYLDIQYQHKNPVSFIQSIRFGGCMWEANDVALWIFGRNGYSLSGDIGISIHFNVSNSLQQC
jgi:hypothetical protein